MLTLPEEKTKLPKPPENVILRNEKDDEEDEEMPLEISLKDSCLREGVRNPKGKHHEDKPLGRHLCDLNRKK